MWRQARREDNNLESRQLKPDFTGVVLFYTHFAGKYAETKGIKIKNGDPKRTGEALWIVVFYRLLWKAFRAILTGLFR